MIYDEMFKKEQSPIVDARRPINGGSGMMQPQMNDPNMMGMGAPMGQPMSQQNMMQPQQMNGQMGGNPLADIGNMGVGGPISQNSYSNQNLPPVQYQQPAAPFYQPEQQNMSGYNQQMNGMSPWAGLPNPSYQPQQQPPQQANYGGGYPPMPNQQPMQPQMPQQQMGYAPQPSMPPQQAYQPPAVSGLQAPTYTTSINMATQAPPPPPQPMYNPGMMQQQPPQMPMAMPPQPYQQQQQFAMPPQQPVMPLMPSAPQQNTTREDPLKPLSSNQPKPDPLEELQALEAEVERASKGEPPPSPYESNLNIPYNSNLSQIENPTPSAQPPSQPSQQNIPQQITSEVPAVPVESVSAESLADLQQLAYNGSQDDMNQILNNPARNVYTPASNIIDNMQTQGVPASLNSINQNINTLNTPLGFDSNGEPIVPASFKKQIRNASVNQGLYPPMPGNMPAPASLNMPPASSINSFEQRMNDMRL